MPERKAKQPSDKVKKIRMKLYAELKNKYLPSESVTREDHLHLLASYITLLPTTELQTSLLNVIVILFFHKKRTKRWADAINLFPADPEHLKDFALLIKDYEALAFRGKVQSLTKANIDLSKVIYYALRVANHRKAFVKAVEDSWRTWPSQIFSEMMVREAARSYKGAFGDLSDKKYDKDFSKVEVLE